MSINKRITSTISRALFHFLLFFLFLFSISLLALHIGFTIPSLKVGNLQISKLYLKWNSKLLFIADKIVINERVNENLSLTIFTSAKENINFAISLFEQIYIDSLSINNKSATLGYSNDHLYLNTENYYFDSMVKFNKNNIGLEVHEFNIKEYNIKFAGSILYDSLNEETKFKGVYNLADKVEGDLSIIQNGNNVNINASSKPFRELKPIVDIFNLGNKADVWIDKKSQAASFELKYLSSSFNINNPLSFEKSLKALVEAKSFNYSFNDELPPAISPYAAITYENSVLNIALHKPTYRKVAIDGSFVRFNNLLGAPNMQVHIASKSPLSSTIKEILHGYEIDIPFTQISGGSKTEVDLYIDLISGLLTPKADISIAESQFKFHDEVFNVKSAELLLEDERLFIDSAKIAYKEVIEGVLSGEIDLNSKDAELNLLISSTDLNITAPKLLDIKDTSIDINIQKSGRGGYLAKSDKLEIQLIIEEDFKGLFFQDLTKFFRYSPFMQEKEISSGHLFVKTDDFRTYYISGKYDNLSYIIYKNDSPVKEFFLTGSISSDVSNLKINSSIDIVDNGETYITLKDLDVDLHSLYSEHKKTLVEKHTHILGLNSSVLLRDGRKIISDRYDAKVTKKSIELNIQHGIGNLVMNFNGKEFLLKGEGFNDAFVKALVKFDSFTGGVYNITAKGRHDAYTASLNFSDAKLHNLAAYNNLISFLDTIPALITFKEPGFDAKGFDIKKGVIEYELKDKQIKFKRIELFGDSIDIIGVGKIDLSSNKIDIMLSLKNVKNLSKILSKIPIAGYLLLGDDGAVTTQVSITGNLDSPTIKTHFIEGIISTPIDMIKRVFSLPRKIFE